MHLLRVWILLALTTVSVAAQFDFGTRSLAFGRQRAVRAELMLSHEAARPGETVMAAIVLQHNPGWHTYWQNAGDSGEATRVFWSLTNGITPGEMLWPVPEKYVDPTVGLITYVYHDRAVLLVPLVIEPAAPSGTHELSALVRWLECEKVCVPGSNTVRATLTIGAESTRSGNTELFAEAMRRLPGTNVPGTVTARWDGPASAEVRPFLIEWTAPGAKADFFPFTNSAIVVSNQTAVLPGTTNVLLRKVARRTGAEWPTQISGLLVREEGGALTGYATTLSLGEGGAMPASFGTATHSFWLLLLYAFLGGMILNVMPCVLPVIALKILGFVNQSRDEPRRVRTLGLIYTLGVIASFLVLAGLVIGVKAAGQKAGWGMQFTNTPFIIVLMVVVTLVALNLFGVFEITLSGRVMGAAGQAASRHGSLGAFMNGVLATVLATPCTAPVLGVALGFAFTQPPHIIVLFFVMVAMGLAFPYLLLSWNPAALRLLPKPGPWMERFKVAMGFPMLATAAWLLSLTVKEYGPRVWWLGLFLVVIALAAWIFGEFVQRGRTRRGVALIVALLLLPIGYVVAIQKGLQHTDEIQWKPWSREAVAEARAQGRVVFVDFTADWCVTCQANKRSSIEIPSVREKLKAINAVPLLGDYTRMPPEMTDELERHGRAGVPLVLVFPRDASKPPKVLPELLTPGIVLEALEEAGR